MYFNKQSFIKYLNFVGKYNYLNSHKTLIIIVKMEADLILEI